MMHVFSRAWPRDSRESMCSLAPSRLRAVQAVPERLAMQNLTNIQFIRNDGSDESRIVWVGVVGVGHLAPGTT